MAKSTTPILGQKPSDDFPLTWHKRAGKWCKRIGPKFFYFSADAGESFKEWLLHKAQFERGIDPRKERSDAITVRLGCNLYLAELKRKEERHEVGPRRFVDMRTCCQHIVDSLGADTPISGLHTEYFSRLRHDIAQRKKSPITLGNELVRVKTVFKWLIEHGKAPANLRFGPDFTKPSAKLVRAYVATKNDPIFTRDELLAILGESPAVLTPMIYLGLSCGFGPTDVAMLQADVDFSGEFLTIPREKTAIDRRVWVWPELRESITHYLRFRPRPADEEAAGRLFIRCGNGRVWGSDKDASSITERFTSAQKRANVYTTRRSFYGLRHTMLSVCTDIGDPLAEKWLMGHVRSDITERYRHKIPDDRIKRLSLHVREWLFGKDAH